MKKTFILAGITSVLFACNNNAGNTGEHADHTGHSEHSDAQNENKEDLSEIHESMDNMMIEMHKAKATGNNEVDFSTMMVAHHKGAVVMSKVLIEKGTDTELKSFAQKVIDDQNKEISFMQELIAKEPGKKSPNSAEFQTALNHSMMTMMNDSTINYKNTDKDYAAQMIPHHQSAVDMAKAYLQFGQDKGLRTLCENIISSQTKEITWLKSWMDK